MWALLALLGFGLGAAGLAISSKQQKEALQLQEEQDILGLKDWLLSRKTELATAEISEEEARFGISTMEMALERFPSYAALEQKKLETEGLEQYRSLMTNYGNINVLAGATRSVAPGTSANILGQRARADVAAFVGEDLTFDTEGGLYGQVWAEMLKNLEAEKMTYEGMKGIYETSLTKITETQTLLEEAITEGETQLEEWLDEVEPPKEEEKTKVQPGPYGRGDLVEPPPETEAQRKRRQATLTHGGMGSPRG